MESINRLLLRFPVLEHDEAMLPEDANSARDRVTISVVHDTAASGRKSEG